MANETRTPIPRKPHRGPKRAASARPGASGENAPAGASAVSPAEAEIAALEQRLAASGMPLSREEFDELTATRQGLADAGLREQGFAQAGECLAGAGL